MSLCNNKAYENHYCKFKRRQGKFCIRIAGSGSSEGAPCDVIMIDGKTYLVEVKATKEVCYKPQKIVREQLQRLQQIALSNSVTAFLAIRFKHRGWLELDISNEIPKRIEYINT